MPRPGSSSSPRLAELASFRQLALVVLAAWAGEWLVLLAGGRLFANELMPEFASFYWLIGTGGPIQPLAGAARRLARAAPMTTRSEGQAARASCRDGLGTGPSGRR